MVEDSGIEPLTSWMQIRRSPSWANPPVKLWWAEEDSNFRPHPYQGCALTNWATGPYISFVSPKHFLRREMRTVNITCVFFRSKSNIFLFILRKEVIQPQVPLRLPCYDFTPVADYTVVKGFMLCLKVEPTSMVWRAVCTRPGNVFTAARWSAITSNSSFMYSSCRVQSELRHFFRICLDSHLCFLLWMPL